MSSQYAHLDEPDDDEEAQPSELMVEIDLGLSAQANARKYYVQKKFAATKEKKTVESGSVALKSAGIRFLNVINNIFCLYLNIINIISSSFKDTDH